MTEHTTLVLNWNHMLDCSVGGFARNIPGVVFLLVHMEKVAFMRRRY
jgi:hypothetical protein